MNRLDIIGRLVKDVEVRTRQDGKTYGMLTVAVNRGFGKSQNGEKPEADFFTCFMNNVEKVAPYLLKGTQVGVSGSIHIQNTKNQDGTYRTSVHVSVQQLELLGTKASNSQPSATGTPVSVAPQAPAPAPQAYAPPQPQAQQTYAPAQQAYAPAPQAQAPAPAPVPQAQAPAPAYAPQTQGVGNVPPFEIRDEEIPF